MQLGYLNFKNGDKNRLKLQVNTQHHTNRLYMNITATTN